MAQPVVGSDDGTAGYGVLGTSPDAAGVKGQVGELPPGGARETLHGAQEAAARLPAGVVGYGYNTGAGGLPGAAPTHGVYGISLSGDGVHGEGGGKDGNGVSGSGPQNGGYGTSTTTEGALTVAGVNGLSNGAGAGVLGQSSGSGPGILAIANGHGDDVAGLLEAPGLGAYVAGDLMVTGDVQLVNSDCAEDFDVATADVEPGTVVILDAAGRVAGCGQEYDKRVVGVISGAGRYRPGIVLGKQQSQCPRMPVALFGKVYCKVDARQFPIAVGDALTTSATSGHAMKVTDRSEAFGSVIGKALGGLDTGLGLIPILVALQ
jgi:hypothetical protein